MPLHALAAGVQFPELGEFDVPGGSRFLGAEHRLAVRGVGANPGVVEAVGLELPQHVIRCLAELAAGARAVVERDLIEVALGGHAADLLGDRGDGRALDELGEVRLSEQGNHQQEGKADTHSGLSSKRRVVSIGFAYGC